MRLINVHNLKFEEYVGDNIPPYAILSHTWSSEEVTFQEWEKPQKPTHKAGFRKILNACRQAELDDLDFLWVDTNCIDKSSSAELSETINSMFVYYGRAVVCYVHLEDVSWTRAFDFTPSDSNDSLDLPNTLERSRWFNRGWTLQELLAPKNMTFFAAPWERLGTKAAMLDLLSDITCIEKKFLKDPGQIYSASIAKRMSWASRRETTRTEDIAYCLLGIFGINMPLIYGEGQRAFIRLQEEIIRTRNDQSIFCWSTDGNSKRYGSGMLAPHPRAFADSSNFVSFRSDLTIAPYTITNAGIHISLPLAYTCQGIIAVLDVVDTYVDPWGRQRVALPMTWSEAGTLKCYCRLRFPRKPILIATAMVEHKKRESLYLQSDCWSSLSHVISLDPGYSLFLTFDMPVEVEWGNESSLEEWRHHWSNSSDFSEVLSCVKAEFAGRVPSDWHKVLVFSCFETSKAYFALLLTGMEVTKNRGGGVEWYSELIPLSQPDENNTDFPTLVIDMLDTLIGTNVSGKLLANNYRRSGTIETGPITRQSAELSRRFPKPIFGGDTVLQYTDKGGNGDETDYSRCIQRALHVIISKKLDYLEVYNQVQTCPTSDYATLWRPSYRSIEEYRIRIRDLVLRSQSKKIAKKKGMTEFWGD